MTAIDRAVQRFLSIDVNNSRECDKLFEDFGPGNYLDGRVADPFARFQTYESLLIRLQQEDPSRYQRFHKGTPFYFLAWLALQLRNYERAVFYMDAALSEDIRKDPSGWINQQSAKFLRLDSPNLQVCQAVAREMQAELQLHFDRFSKNSGQHPLTITSFRCGFIDSLLHDANTRSILVTMLIHALEFRDNRALLDIRSSTGGSLAPLITHLFQGALVFESLLKHVYSVRANGRKLQTLGDVFSTTAFKKDFPSANGIRTSATCLQDVLADVGNGQSRLIEAFQVTAKLRNTTGHNLIWNDSENVLGGPGNYEQLVEREWDALLFLISTHFPCASSV